MHVTEKSWGWKTKCLPLSIVPMAAQIKRLEDLPASFSHAQYLPSKNEVMLCHPLQPDLFSPQLFLWSAGFKPAWLSWG